jgi:flagellar biosynthesis/type III secretory pathway protein FliH
VADHAAIRPVSLPDLTAIAAARAARPPQPAGGVMREGQRIAAAVVARAEAQAREIQAAAREQGYARGVGEARAREGAALRSAAALLADAARDLAAERATLRARLEADLPGLAVALAGRILRHELSRQPELYAQLVRDAVTAVGPAGRLRLLVHPDDLAGIERHRGLIADALAGAELQIDAAPDVEPTGFRIDTETLSLAAGVPQLLERALALLGGTDQPA